MKPNETGTPAPAPEQAHTQEPWHVATNPGGPGDQPAFPSIRDSSGLPDGEDIVAMPLGFSEVVKANASRIVACVNALAGLNPSALSDVVKALEDAEEALDILRVSHECRGDFYDGYATNTVPIVRAALASLKGAIRG